MYYYGQEIENLNVMLGIHVHSEEHSLKWKKNQHCVTLNLFEYNFFATVLCLFEDCMQEGQMRDFFIVVVSVWVPLCIIKSWRKNQLPLLIF